MTRQRDTLNVMTTPVLVVLTLVLVTLSFVIWTAVAVAVLS
jgi:hypothetical protein